MQHTCLFIFIWSSETFFFNSKMFDRNRSINILILIKKIILTLKNVNNNKANKNQVVI